MKQLAWPAGARASCLCRGVALVVLLGALHAWAAVEVSLPLEGFYRPGKYMPVKYAADAGAALVLEGEDVVPTRIEVSPGRAEGIAPVLPLDEAPRALRWRVKDRQGAVEWMLRPLGVDQRLVGFLAVDLELARGLFPGRSIVPIRLDPAHPLPGPAAAWQTLDAVVLDAASAGQLTEARVAALLSGGTMVVVRSAGAPDAKWPWKKVGECWALSAAMEGPKQATPNPLAFSAVQGWEADWPVALRRRVVLYGLVFAILMLGVGLLRVKYVILAGVGLSVVTVSLLGWWWSGRSAVVERVGEVAILGQSMAQEDVWTYRASAHDARTFVPWAGGMWPFFESKADRAAMDVTLICRSNGEPVGFAATCRSGLKLALLSRNVGIATTTPQTRPAERNPLVLMAQRLYLRPGVRIAGEVPATMAHPDWSEVYPSLVLRRDE